MVGARVHGRRGSLPLASEMTDAEAELVLRATADDRRAFSALVELHWARLVRLARSVVGEAEAEDAVQDGLVAAWRRLGELRQPAAFGPWVTRVVLRLCLRRSRRRRPWAPLDAVAEPAWEDDPGARLDVPRLLAALAPRQRAVMHLTAVDGLTDGEIAVLLSLTPAGVRSHRRRARRRLERLLAATPAGRPAAAAADGAGR